MGCYPSAHVNEDSPSRQAQPCPGIYYNKSKPFKRLGLAWTSDTPITLAQLEQKRLLFWETVHFYGGRLEVWQALQAAFSEVDIMMARSILEAVNVTLPTGNPCEGCFDELGNSYEIPIYCIVQPTNLTDEDVNTSTSIESVRKEQDSGIDTNISHAPPPDCSDNYSSLIVRLSTLHDISIKISSKEETVGSLRLRLFDTPEAGIDAQTHSLRLIYLGKVLKDSTRIICYDDDESKHTSTEDAIEVNDKSVVQALVSKRV
ncbi:hypothetical protein K501DRAFT_251317 [Backusella circina FSU 941]|nr:hypothetical protein K501DRAFT_251317 [Backusella circina FSU 941]